MCWQALSAIATCVLALGVVFAFIQVRRIKLSTNAQLAVELFRELRNTNVKEVLRDIIYKEERERIIQLPNYKIKQIEQVIDWLDLLGGLVKGRIIDEKLAIETYAGAPALRCWYQLGEHFIPAVIQERGSYCLNLEDFVKRTIKYYMIRYPKSKWITFYREVPSRKVNTVEYFSKKLLSKREFCNVKFQRTLRSIYKPSLREKI